MSSGLIALLSLMGCTDDPTSLADSGATPDLTDSGDEIPWEGPFIRPQGDIPQNLLVISIDTLRRDRMGALGGTTATPVMDALAAEGVLLADHHSCANWTFPSVLCAQTGRTTLQLEFHPDPGSVEDRYDQTFPTLSTLFRDAGFGTALTTGNSFFRQANGTANGFEEVALFSYESVDATLPSALEQLGAAVSSGKPFYQHVHLMDPHTPYTAEESWWGVTTGLSPMDYDLSTEIGLDELLSKIGGLSTEERAEVLAWLDVVYEADVRKMDAGIGEFLAQAQDLGALDSTLVMFWSDHGEQFFEDDLFGHGRGLHDEETDSIALFWMANEGLVPGIWTGPTASWDLAPTVMDAMGLSLGEDFMGSVVGTAPRDRRRLGVHWSFESSALSTEVEGWKLIYHWDGSYSLYDRNQDRGEELDLAGSETERAQTLWGILKPQVHDLYAIHPEVSAPVDPEF
jgi:arylsulfatase A-like enzyme